MVDENSADQNGREDSEENVGAGDDLRAMHFTLSRPPGGIHEHNVHGSVIEQTMHLLEGHMKPDIIDVIEPETGVPALVIVTAQGELSPVPESVFDANRVQPKHRRGTATMFNLESFIEHTNRFKSEASAVFANNDRANPSLTTVLDYHPAGNESAPAFGKHRTSFKFPVSDEWKAWQKGNKVIMSMEDFAFFLEERVIDVMPNTLVDLTDEGKRFVAALPGASTESKIADPAKLMTMATEFKVLEHSIVGEARNTSTGEASIQFQSEHIGMDGQKLVVPQIFVIGIPVFLDGDAYQIIARLRYRKTGGKVVFWYDLWRTDRVFDHAFDEAVQEVENKTDLPVLIGADEGACASI